MPVLLMLVLILMRMLLLVSNHLRILLGGGERTGVHDRCRWLLLRWSLQIADAVAVHRGGVGIIASCSLHGSLGMAVDGVLLEPIGRHLGYLFRGCGGIPCSCLTHDLVDCRRHAT